MFLTLNWKADLHLALIYAKDKVVEMYYAYLFCSSSAWDKAGKKEWSCRFCGHKEFQGLALGSGSES